MIGVALKGLASRKFRALLTALAVVIGVSMISGTYILTDTMQKAFDGIFESSYADRVLFLADGRIVDEMRQPTAEAVIDRMKRFDVPGRAS